MNTRGCLPLGPTRRVGDFVSSSVADFKTPILLAVAVSPAQPKAAGLFDALNHPDTGPIAQINANATTQQTDAGDFHRGTTSKTVLRDALLLELRGLNRTAVVAEEGGTPGVMDSFRMPHCVSDITLAARARSMGQAATRLAAQFEALGQDTTFLADLETHINAFEGADSSQNTGEETQAGATASFNSLLSEAFGKVKSLDAIVHNMHKGDAAKLGAWKTASHVELQPKTTVNQPPANL